MFSLFIDLRASGKYSHLDNSSKISQNYAGKVLLKLGDISKTIKMHGDVYNLRGVIAFNGSARQLRESCGHYKAYALRSNDQWQCYDDLKEEVLSKSSNFKVNTEILLYKK
jgi:ubiquitin C-terminal hydrolase